MEFNTALRRRETEFTSSCFDKRWIENLRAVCRICPSSSDNFYSSSERTKTSWLNEELSKEALLDRFLHSTRLLRHIRRELIMLKEMAQQRVWTSFVCSLKGASLISSFWSCCLRKKITAERWMEATIVFHTNKQWERKFSSTHLWRVENRSNVDGGMAESPDEMEGRVERVCSRAARKMKRNENWETHDAIVCLVWCAYIRMRNFHYHG